MKQEELFPGAVVLHPVDGPITVTGYNKSLVYFSNNQGQWPAAIDVANLAPVPITPEILLMLEGENFSISDTHGQKDSFLIVAGDFDVYIKWVGDAIYYGSHYPPQIRYLHELQTRVRLDAGIVLNLKQK